MDNLRAGKPPIQLLVPIWGKKYIDYFFQLSLPSLLAHGNIPYLSKSYDVTLVFLTKPCDENTFLQHPAIEKIKSFCNIEFIFIDDLIVVGNYSTTLTLAYERAVRATADRMLETYFVFLTADFIFANHCFIGLDKYIRQGYSGICSGNFQVVQERIEPMLFDSLEEDNTVLSLDARTLLEMSFQCLHPIVLASMFNMELLHNYYANRFYLRVDEHTLAGRFYLLHMLCIKPEVADFTIGSSCDYSFIPSMCPSGNVGIIKDSDDYLVIEVQPVSHEIDYLSLGKPNYKKLIHALGDWTTAVHRKNSEHTIYYHSKPLEQRKLAETEAKLTSLIGKMNKRLEHYSEHLHDNHHYWNGMISDFKAQCNLKKKYSDEQFYDIQDIQSSRWIKRFFFKLVGTPPQVKRWHYRWREYQQAMSLLSANLDASPEENIIFFTSFKPHLMRWHSWLKKQKKIDHQYLFSSWVETQEKNSDAQVKNSHWRSCIFFVDMQHIDYIADFMKKNAHWFHPQTNILFFFTNEHNQYPELVYNFKNEFIKKMNCLIAQEYSIKEISIIYNTFTLWGSALREALKKKFSHHKMFHYLSYAVLGLPLAFFVLLCNLNPFKKINENGHCTQLIVKLAFNAAEEKR